MTLAQRLNEGQMPVTESLRLAMSLAQALRRLHDRGQVHGAVTPSNLTITEQGLELLPAASGSTTAYTAPEVALGRSPDARSDVFSFGAILFEMLTGRRAAESEGAAPSTGSRAADRLLLPCLARDPDARTPRIQRVVLELKLLMVTARRAAAAEKRRLGMRELEARIESRTETQLDSRMQAHEQNLAAFHRSAVEAMAALKVMAGKVERVERTIEEMKERTQQFELSVAADLVDLEEGLKTQSSSIQSMRTAMSQTDDLVKRVVEALEKLQAAVLDERGMPGPRSPNIIN